MHHEAFKAQTSLISLHAQRQESISSLSAFDLTSVDFDFVLDASDPIHQNNFNHNQIKQTQFSSHDIDSMLNESIKSNFLNVNNQQPAFNEIDFQLESNVEGIELDLNMLDFLLQDPPSIASSSTYDQLSSPSAEVSFTSLNENSSSIESPSFTNSEEESILSVSDLKRKSRLGRVKKGGDVNKRESNKAAANRYRLKKLKEKDDLFNECEKHELKNIELKRKIDDVQTEINCIKNLLVEALLSKKNGGQTA